MPKASKNKWMNQILCSSFPTTKNSRCFKPIGYHSKSPSSPNNLYPQKRQSMLSALKPNGFFGPMNHRCQAIIPLSCGSSHGDCAAALVLMGDAYFPDRMVTHSWSNLYLGVLGVEGSFSWWVDKIRWFQNRDWRLVYVIWSMFFFPWFVEFSCHFIDLNMQKIVHQQCTIIACHTARSMPRGLVPRFACLVAAVVADALDLPSYETWWWIVNCRGKVSASG